MSNDNYPAGVTNSHPYFNPPRELALELECGADEALVVPSFAVKVALSDMRHYVENLVKLGHTPGSSTLTSIAERLDQLREQIDGWEQEREYECPFKGEVDVEESECARWDCPVCGNERESDTLPEERDPDEEWERRNER